MSTTDKLLELDKTLVLHNEGEWNNTVSIFSAFNSGGVEVEVGEFLHGLVRVLKPEHVLETGTHLGIGARYIGLALKENDGGHLDTLEYIPEIHRETKKQLEAIGLGQFITCHCVDALKFKVDKKYGLVFLDTEPHTRFRELLRFWPHLQEGGIVLIHDLHGGMGQTGMEMNGMMNWPFGTMPEDMKRLIQTHQLQSFHFATPRGLYMAQKSSPDFYSTRLLTNE